MKTILAFAFVCGAQIILAQPLSGVVVEMDSQRAIPFAECYSLDLEMGIVANEFGEFTFEIELPEVPNLKISAYGYHDKIVVIDRSKEIIIELREAHLEIQGVSVSSAGTVIQSENAIYIETRKMSDLMHIPGSMGEVLTNIPGVYQASSGTGISKPVIRGMQGTRIVTLLNGLRIENQQWGGDHGMAITSLGIGAVEIMKGPASLAYGADALGGVIYFADEPYVRQNTHQFKFASRFESATLGHISTGQFGISKKNLRFSIAGLYSDHADYKLPDGRYAGNTRYYERGIKTSFGWNKKNWIGNLRYAFARNRIGIAGHSEDSIPNLESFKWPTQERGVSEPAQLIDNHFASLENKWSLKRSLISLLVGHTYSNLREYEEDEEGAAIDLTVNSSTYNLKWKIFFDNMWTMVLGSQGGIQSNRNAKNAPELLIPSFDQQDLGGYGILYYHYGNFHMQSGVRYDRRALNALEDVFFGALKSSYESVNGSVGAVYDLFTVNKFRLNVSTGFRAPHVSELLSDGIHHGAMRYEIGTISLKSERANQLDFIYELEKEHVELVVNPFFNYMLNYIYLNPIDSVIDGLNVYKYEQMDIAQLYGVDLALHFHPHFAHWLHLETSYSYLRGESNSGENLSLIPQARIKSSVRFMLSKFFKSKFGVKEITLQHSYLFDQNDVAQTETVSRQFNLIDIGMVLKGSWKTPLEIGIGVKNLLNENYIDHLSRLKNIGLSQQARNFYVQLKYTINSKPEIISEDPNSIREIPINEVLKTIPLSE